MAIASAIHSPKLLPSSSTSQMSRLFREGWLTVRLCEISMLLSYASGSECSNFITWPLGKVLKNMPCCTLNEAGVQEIERLSDGLVNQKWTSSMRFGRCLHAVVPLIVSKPASCRYAQSCLVIFFRNVVVESGLDFVTALLRLANYLCQRHI